MAKTASRKSAAADRTPRAAVKRESEVLERRLQVELAKANNAVVHALGAMYRSAGDSRLRKDLRSARGSDDAVQYAERESVVNVSRALLAQSPVYDAFLERMLDFTVGTGLVPVGEGKNTPADEACRYFQEWFDRDADVRGMDDGGEIQRKILREVLAFGDQVIVKVFDASTSDGEQRIQLTPSHLLASPSRGPVRHKADASGPRISDGVEMNDAGRPTKFWINSYDTTGGSINVGKATARAVPAESALYIAWRKFGGQTRGMPWLAHVLERFIDVNEFIDAVVTAAKLQAALAVLVVSKSPGAMNAKLQSGAQNAAGQGTSGSSTRTQNLMDMNPGQVLVMPEGSDAKALQGSQPNATFDMFTRGLIMLACAGSGLPMEIAIGDYSKANFSVSRMARIAARQTAMPVRQLLIRRVLDPLFAWRIDRGIATGRLKASLRERYFEMRWQAPAMVPVDPKAEIDAYNAGINANLFTKKSAIDELGGDIDQVFTQRAAEKKQERELGIEPTEMPGAKVASGESAVGSGEKPEPDEDEDEDDDT